MTETLLGVSPPLLEDPDDPPSAEELAAAKELVRQARAQRVALTGLGGLLKALTTVLETALEERGQDRDRQSLWSAFPVGPSLLGTAWACKAERRAGCLTDSRLITSPLSTLAPYRHSPFTES